MKVIVRFFALYRERVGTSQRTYDLPHGTTMSHLLKEIRNHYPDMAPPHVEIVAAVNTEYARSDIVLSEGDEVALIPPVSGGRE